jgi:2',5'-phosphodiesterase
LLKPSDAPTLAHVVSYNVLSSSLADSEHFPKCDPADLEAHTRLARLLAKLEEPIASRAVICLQEVSLAWTGPLHAFFASRRFHFVVAHYGSYFNGYMGVALAFPIDSYDALDVKVERLTDGHSWPPPAQPTGVVRALADLRTRVVGAWNALFAALPGSPGYAKQKAKLRAVERRRRKPSDVWLASRDRRNILIFARLRSKANGARLCVGTYHMPCAFFSPPMMLIHSALVVRRFQEMCGGDPAVLAGDFNFKPTDSTYKMVTTGKIDPKHRDYPSKGPDGSPATNWMPVPRSPMKSAYKDVLGHEPDFTNFSVTEDNAPFIETLDYIFCSPDLDVVDVIRLPHRATVPKAPYPAPSEPSDHSLIGATLRLPAPSASRRAAPYESPAAAAATSP